MTNECGIQVYTLREAVEFAGMGLFQIKLLILMIFFHMIDSMEMMLLSVLSSPMHCEWFLSSENLAHMTMSLFLGMAIFSPLWGIAADKLGRRPILFSSTLFIAYFGLLSAFSPNHIWFTFLRFLVGCALPGAYLAFVILSECLPAKHKNWVLVLYQLSSAIGTVSESVISGLVLPNLNWRYLVGITSIPLWCSLIMLMFIPESPEYCLISNQTGKVENLVKNMIRQNGKTPPKNLRILPLQKQVIPGRIQDLFKDRRTIRITLQLWFISLCTNFLYYGMVLLLSESVRKEYDHCTGISAFMNPGSETCVCKHHGWDYYTGLIKGATGELAGFAINFMFLDPLGRVNTCGVEYTMMGVFILLLITCTSNGVRDFFQFIIRALTMAGYGSVYVYLIEFYSPEVRALAYGCFNTGLRIGAMVTPYVAQVLTDYSFLAAYIIYGCVSIIMGISCFFLPETRPGFIERCFRRKCSSFKSPQEPEENNINSEVT